MLKNLVLTVLMVTAPFSFANGADKTSERQLMAVRSKLNSSFQATLAAILRAAAADDVIVIEAEIKRRPL